MFPSARMVIFLLLLLMGKKYCVFAAEPARNSPASPAPSRPLIFAFASFRDQPAFSGVYFYLHDGIGKGRIIGGVTHVPGSGKSRPSLTAGGKVCAYAFKETGGFPARMKRWDLSGGKSLDEVPFTETQPARIDPALTGDGHKLYFSAWSFPDGSGGWDVVLHDFKTGKTTPVAGINSQSDEREVNVSQNGQWLAAVSNRNVDRSLNDLVLFDLTSGKLVPLPEEVNTPNRELNPSLNHDGTLLAFVSERKEGAGGKDIYLYDLTRNQMLPLPGLNSIAHEQTPSISPDGRYLAFISERVQGPGERDIYLYDRVLAKLIPTPGLNSPQEDFDPALTYDSE